MKRNECCAPNDITFSKNTLPFVDFSFVTMSPSMLNISELKRVHYQSIDMTSNKMLKYQQLQTVE